MTHMNNGEYTGAIDADDSVLSSRNVFARLLDIILNVNGKLPGQIKKIDKPGKSHASIKSLIHLYYLSGDPVDRFHLPSASEFKDGDYVIFSWETPGERGWDKSLEKKRDGRAINVQMISEEEAKALKIEIESKLFETLRRQAQQTYDKKREEYEQKSKDLANLEDERNAFDKRKEEWETNKAKNKAELKKLQEQLAQEDRALAPYRRLLPAQNAEEDIIEPPPPIPFNNLYNEWPQQLELLGYQFNKGGKAENAVNSFLLSTAASLYTGSLILLNGPVGAGKTSIIEKAAKILSAVPQAASVIPVRPAWIDSTDLLGFFDPISNLYRPTPFVDALLKAGQLSADHVLFFLCLDELNLARIENYGADLLSRFEYAHDSERQLDASNKKSSLLLYSSDIYVSLKEELDSLKDAEDLDLKLQQRRVQLCRQLIKYPANLAIPPNLLLLGTLNADETTYELSPKVIDRSYVITYPPADLSGNGDENKSAQEGHQTLTPSAFKNLDAVRRISTSELLKQMKQKIDATSTPPGWETIRDWNQNFLSKGISIPLSYRSKRDFEAFSAAAHCFGLDNTDEVVGHFLFTKILPRIRLILHNRIGQGTTSDHIDYLTKFFDVTEKFKDYDPAGILSGLSKQANDPQLSVVRYFGMDRL